MIIRRAADLNRYIQMTSKERVYAALRREPADRVPVFMWFHPSTTKHLARLLGIPHPYVSRAMGNDIAQAWVNNNFAMEGIVHENEGEGHVDFWGIEWVKRGPFNQIARYPLEKATKEQVLGYCFPWNHIDELLKPMEALANGPRDLFLGCDISPCEFEMYWRLRGMERAMTDMVMEPDLAFEMLGRCAEFAAALGEAACSRFALDWLWTGDDVAGQRAMLMSPELWRDQIKPHLKRVVNVGKSRGLCVAFHSCGAVRPIIGDLVEIGVDVLNPIQCTCPGMAPLELKREFGKALSFMGGVDTQGVLLHGSVEDVRRATAQLIEGMTTDGGGYILAASHIVPPETPDKNIFAMYSEAGIRKEEVLDRAADIREQLRGKEHKKGTT